MQEYEMKVPQDYFGHHTPKIGETGQREHEQLIRILDQKDQELGKTVRFKPRPQVFVRPKNGRAMPDGTGGFIPAEGMNVDVSSYWIHRRIREGSLEVSAAQSGQSDQSEEQATSEASSSTSEGETEETAEEETEAATSTSAAPTQPSGSQAFGSW